MVLNLVLLCIFFVILFAKENTKEIWFCAVGLCAIFAFATPVSIFLSTTLVAYLFDAHWIKLSIMATTGILGAKTLNSAFIGLGLMFMSIKSVIRNH